MEQRQSLLGIGIYTVPEAARMTRVSSRRIRRWMKGYAYESQGKRRTSARLWAPELPELEGQLAVGFRDMLEVRFVSFFLDAGVSWPTLRKAAEGAAEMIESTHPFSTGVFKTDGKQILSDEGSGAGRKLLDVVYGQHNIPSIIAPFLHEGVVYEENNPILWHPLENNKRVVINPRIALGQATVQPSGIPTKVLAGAAAAAGDIASIAAWYDVPRRAVEDAIEYEKSLDEKSLAA
jgi:uncharacterized protein (DUF433 family)